MSQLGSVSAKDLDTPSVGLNSWEGLWSHLADSANERPWNSVWLLQPHKDFHVLPPAMLWWELNRAWEGQFCIWLTKLRPCESFRGHQLGRAQHLRGWLFSVQLEQAPEKENWGKPWTLQSLASMLLLTLSVCDVLFSSYKAGNNFASDPLSLVWGKSFHHKFIIIWFGKELQKKHKSPKSKTSANTLLLMNYLPSSIYYVSYAFTSEQSDLK